MDNVFIIRDNVYENSFFIKKIVIDNITNHETIFILLPDIKKENYFYISDLEDEFVAIFDYVNDTPLSEDEYPELYLTFSKIENFYLQTHKLGIFHKMNNSSVELKPDMNNMTLKVEPFLKIINDIKLEIEGEKQRAFQKQKNSNSNWNSDLMDALKKLKDEHEQKEQQKDNDFLEDFLKEEKKKSTIGTRTNKIIDNNGIIDDVDLLDAIIGNDNF